MEVHSAHPSNHDDNGSSARYRINLDRLCIQLAVAIPLSIHDDSMGRGDCDEWTRNYDLRRLNTARFRYLGQRKL